MPEGDTIRRAADRIGPVLAGERIVAARSRWAHVADGLVGRTCAGVDAKGKHLLLTLPPDVVRIHLGMPGRVHALPPDAAVTWSLGNIGLQLDTARGRVVVVKAPTVDRFPARELGVHPALRALGPDLLAPDVDWDEVLARAAASSAPTVAELLLDQTVACGVGNVVKNEVLFAAGLSPFLPPAQVPAERLRDLYGRARTVLAESVARGWRKTTAPEVRADHQVYSRAGRPCPRCGTPIRAEAHGAELPRLTYWCPSCQAG